MSEMIEQLSPIPADKPLSECTTGELLSHVGRLALMRAAELMAPAVSDHLDTREMRRVEVGGNIGIKTMARVQVALMQARADQNALIEYEQAVARQEKLLGLQPLSGDGSKYRNKPKRKAGAEPADTGSKAELSRAHQVTGDPA